MQLQLEANRIHGQLFFEREKKSTFVLLVHFKEFILQGQKKGTFLATKRQMLGQAKKRGAAKNSVRVKKKQRRLKESVGERGQGQSLLMQGWRVMRRHVQGQGSSSANNSK